MVLSLQTLVAETQNNALHMPRIEDFSNNGRGRVTIVYDSQTPSAGPAVLRRLDQGPGESADEFAIKVLKAAEEMRDERLTQWRNLAFELDQKHVHSPDAFVRVVLQNKSAQPLANAVRVKYIAANPSRSSEWSANFDAAVGMMDGVTRVNDNAEEADIVWLEDANQTKSHLGAVRKQVPTDKPPHTVQQWMQHIVTAILHLRTQRIRPTKPWPATGAFKKTAISDLAI